MATIEEFVDNRWVDAKEALRTIDRAFVTRLESTPRLNALQLAAPWTLDELERKSTRRLTTRWHLLLEACAELVMQLLILEESVAVLATDKYHSVSPVRAGRQALFHLRSWAIHAKALTERVTGVIDCSIKVYSNNSRA